LKTGAQEDSCSGKNGWMDKIACQNFLRGAEVVDIIFTLGAGIFVRDEAKTYIFQYLARPVMSTLQEMHGLGDNGIEERQFWEVKGLQKVAKNRATIHGHRTLKALHPVRSAKLSGVPLSQYCGGGPRWNTECCG
jgi:hypothetical protein